MKTTSNPSFFSEIVEQAKCAIAYENRGARGEARRGGKRVTFLATGDVHARYCISLALLSLSEMTTRSCRSLERVGEAIDIPSPLPAM